MTDFKRRSQNTHMQLIMRFHRHKKLFVPIKIQSSCKGNCRLATIQTGFCEFLHFYYHVCKSGSGHAAAIELHCSWFETTFAPLIS